MAAEIVNKRLSNRVIAGLEDIVIITQHAMFAQRKAHERAQLRCADPALLLSLAELRGDILEIQLLATAARRGEYAGNQKV